MVREGPRCSRTPARGRPRSQGARSSGDGGRAEGRQVAVGDAVTQPDPVSDVLPQASVPWKAPAMRRDSKNLHSLLHGAQLFPRTPSGGDAPSGSIRSG